MTVALRGRPDRVAISPKKAPSPRGTRATLCPAGSLTNTFTVPVVSTKRLCPGSPSVMMMSPASKLSRRRPRMTASSSSSSKSSKSGLAMRPGP